VTAKLHAPVALTVWLLTAVGQASVGPAAEVKLVGGRVLIEAKAVSVAEVLDRLARATGMKVVYEGAPPSDRLTASIDASSETEAVSRLLEGLGLTYAFKLDPTGRRVETLLLTSQRTTARSSSPAPARAVNQYVPEEPEQEPIDTMESPTDAAPDPTGMAPDTPGMDPVTGGYLVAPDAAPAAEPQSPYPAPASYPSSPFNPTFPPTFPAPASYP
jgi:hypothetical protein